MRKSASSIHIRLIRHLREWHRKLGIVAAFFLIFLSITGIALNHTDFFNLPNKPITNNWMLEHYGIQAPSDIRFYQEKQLLITNKLAWFNNQFLFESTSTIIGAGKINKFLVIVTENQLHLYDEKGHLIDQLDGASGVPSDISAIAIEDDNLLVNTANGYFQTNEQFFDWSSISTFVEPRWILPIKVKVHEKNSASLLYKSRFLTVERIILDAHSGRIFGNIGVLFMDFVGILLVLLSLSGIYIWIRYARSKR